MESNTILEASNLGSANTDCDDDDDESELLELNEKIRAAEEFSRELKLRNRTKTDLESVLQTDDDISIYQQSLLHANDDDLSQNLFEEKLLDQNFEELEILAKPAEKLSRELKHQRTTEYIDLESNLSTASASNGKEFLGFPEKTLNTTENDLVELNIIKQKNIKNLKSLKRKADLHKLLVEKSLKQKIKKSALYLRSEKELPKTTENVDLNSNASTVSTNSDNKSRNESEKKLLNQKIEEAGSSTKSAEMNEEFTLQNTSENIYFESNSDVNDNTFLEDQLEEKILNKKLRAAKKFGRLLKQKNITSQIVSSASDEWNLELLKGNPDLYKLLGDKSKILDGHSREEALDILNKAQSVNLHRQAFLSNWEKCIGKALEKNLNLQDLVATSASLKDTRNIFKQWNTYTSAVFGMPYFKEKDKTMSCPPNADTRLRTENDHPLIPARDDSGRWSPKETSKLKMSVLEILRDKIIANLSFEIEEIRRPNDGKNQSDQIDILNEKMSKMKAMSLKELMSETSIDNDYDWQAISLNTFTGFRSPNECRGYFEMCLDPTRNPGEWTKEENEKLSLLADKYSCQDWDAIATDLGTNRSAYKCCLHFQKELDRNVRAVGKWSEEEDSKLMEAVRTFRVGNHIPWTKISFAVTTRSVWQIRNRWIESLAPHRKKGRFSVEEDKLMLKAVEQHGCSFAAVAAMFPNRTALQIRGRYQRVIENANIKGRWSLEEDKLLMQLVEKIGAGKWKEISEHIITRSRTQVRQRYEQIMSFKVQYPNLEVADMHRGEPKTSDNSDNKVDPQSETVVSNTKSSVPKIRTEQNITDTADVSEDLPNTRKTRKRKSEVTESSSVKDIKPPPKRRKRSGAASEDRFDSILKSINQRSYQKTPAGRKLVSYFQEAYPMQAIVGKKTWDEADISSQAQWIFDLSHILRVDFSYIDNLTRQKSVRPYLLRQTVNRLIENHSNDLLRLNPVTSDNHSHDARQDCDVACESDATTSLIDVPPLPVEETLCSDPFPEDFVDQVQSSQNEEEDEKPADQMEKQLELIRTKKKEFMEFPFLVPPNVATAVGYRSLLLVERKLKDKVSTDADEDNDTTTTTTLPPDYSSSEFRLKDEDKVLAANNQLDMDKCVRFTKEEAIHMFKERLKTLFAGPIVLGECADRYFNVNNLPIYKKEGTPIKSKRRTTSDRYQELQNSKLASLADKISQEIHIELGGTTETPYSMPSLDSVVNCEPSTSKSQVYNCQPSTSKLFEDCQPSTSRSENSQPSTSRSVINCTSSSSSGESSSSLVDKQSTVKPKNRASKTLDSCQPGTSKSDNCQPGTSMSGNNCNPSTSSSLGPSIE